MTREETRKFLDAQNTSDYTPEQLEVMQAYADGATIEVLNKSFPYYPYYTVSFPVWNFKSYDYRIKQN